MVFGVWNGCRIGKFVCLLVVANGGGLLCNTGRGGHCPHLQLAGYENANNDVNVGKYPARRVKSNIVSVRVFLGCCLVRSQKQRQRPCISAARGRAKMLDTRRREMRVGRFGTKCLGKRRKGLRQTQRASRFSALRASSPAIWTPRTTFQAPLVRFFACFRTRLEGTLPEQRHQITAAWLITNFCGVWTAHLGATCRHDIFFFFVLACSRASRANCQPNMMMACIFGPQGVDAGCSTTDARAAWIKSFEDLGSRSRF